MRYRSTVAMLCAATALAACAAPAVPTQPPPTVLPTLPPPTATVAPALTSPTATPGPINTEAPAEFRAEFSTNFKRSAVNWDDVLSGGPPKDGIPAIDSPGFVDVTQANTWLDDREPVISVQHNGEVRAYPIQVLTWHEIANDTLGGKPLAITFCPLCNTAIVFERTVDGRVLDFGTTGRLRFSNLIMYDRQTETWWQQGSGKALAGDLLGKTLVVHPAALISWGEHKRIFGSRGSVLSQDTGYRRAYGANPYVSYDTTRPFLYRGPAVDARLNTLERVLGLEHKGDAVAFAYNRLLADGTLNVRVGGEPVVVLWREGAASALDSARIANGRDVGMAMAFAATLPDGRTLTFRKDGTAFRDAQTGSTWNVFGEAGDGPLKGMRLTPLPAVNHFWFSWVAFYPATRVEK